MKSIKRILTAALVLAMMVTMITVPTYAAAEKVVLAAIDPANVSIADVVATSDAAYLSGAKLGSANLDADTGLISATAADLSKINDEFKVEDGYVWGYVHNQGSATEDRALSKHFSPINDGETLNLSATVQFNYATPNHSTHYIGQSFEISGASGSIPLIQYGFSPDIQTVRFLSDGGKNYFQNYRNANTDVTTTGQFRWMYDPKPLNGNDIFSNKGADSVDYIYAFANKADTPNALDGDITLNLTAAPNASDSSKYDLTLVTSGLRISATSTRTVDKALVLGLSDFHMVTSRSTTDAQVTAEKLNGLKALEISTVREKIIPDADIEDVYVADAAVIKSNILLFDKQKDMSVSDFVLKSDAAYTSGSKWGVDSEADKTNGWVNEDEYLWGTLHNHASEHNAHTASKKFNGVENGETLKLTARFKLNFAGTSPWHYSGIQLKGDNGEVLRLFDLKTNDYYAYMHLLSSFANNDTTEAYKDANVTTTGWTFENGTKTEQSGNNVFAGDDRDNLPKFNLQAKQEGGYARPFDGILKLTLTAKPSAADANKYDLTQVLEGKNISLTSTTTVDAAKITALNSFNILVGNASDVADGGKLIGVRDVKIAQLNTSGKKVLANINPASASISDVVVASDASYLSGAALGSSNLDFEGNMSSTDADISKIYDEFKVEDGYIYGYVHNQGAATQNRALSKHFAPISDGETLNLLATVRFNHATPNDATHYIGQSIELSGSNGNLALVQYGFSPVIRTLRFLSNGGKDYFQNVKNVDTSVTTTIEKLTHGSGSNVFTDTNLSTNNIICDHYSAPAGMINKGLRANVAGNTSPIDGDVTLNLTAAPASEEGKYLVTLKVVGPNIKATSTKTVDKALVLGLSDFHLVTSRSANASQVAVERLIGLKKLSISSPATEIVSSELKAGENKAYIPVKLPADTKADFSLVVAVCDKTTEQQKDFYIRHYEDYKNVSDNLEIDFNISAPLDEFVKVYVFDGFDSLVPYATSSTIGK